MNDDGSIGLPLREAWLRWDPQPDEEARAVVGRAVREVVWAVRAQPGLLGWELWLGLSGEQRDRVLAVWLARRFHLVRVEPASGSVEDMRHYLTPQGERYLAEGASTERGRQRSSLAARLWAWLKGER